MTPRESDMLKVAYAIGLEQSGMSKEAIWGALGGNALKLIGKGLWGGAKATGKGLVSQPARSLYAKAGRGIGKGLVQTGQTAKQLMFGVGKAAPALKPGQTAPLLQRMGGASGATRATNMLTLGGRALPGQMVGFGAFGGAVGGLSDPNKSWSWGGAGKGFLGGAAGGAGWHLGGKAMRGGLRALAKKPGGRLQKVVGQRGAATTGLHGAPLTGKAKQKAGMGFGDIWKSEHGLGETGKMLGVKALTALPVGAAMLGGTMAAEQGLEHAMSGGKPDVASQFRQRYYPGAAVAGGAARGFRRY